MSVWEGVAMDSNVSFGAALPDPSTPREGVTPKTALLPFQGSPTLRPSSTLLDTPRHTPMGTFVAAAGRGCRVGGRLRMIVGNGLGLSLWNVWVVDGSQKVPLGFIVQRHRGEIDGHLTD
jgi:hypothetical protein